MDMDGTARDDRIYRYLLEHDSGLLRSLPSGVIDALALGSEAEVIEEGAGLVYLRASSYAYAEPSRYIFAFLPDKRRTARHCVRAAYVGNDGNLYHMDGIEGFSDCFVGFGEAPRFPAASFSVSVTAFEWPEDVALDKLRVRKLSQARTFINSAC